MKVAMGDVDTALIDAQGDTPGECRDLYERAMADAADRAAEARRREARGG